MSPVSALAVSAALRRVMLASISFSVLLLPPLPFRTSLPLDLLARRSLFVQKVSLPVPPVMVA